MSSGISLVVDLPKEDAELLCKCGELMVGNESTIKGSTLYASPLGRFGYTGSRLYKMRIGEHGGVQYAAKINDADKIRREFDAVNQVRTRFGDADRAICPPDEVHGKRAIVYPLYENPRSPLQELNKVVFDGDNIGSSSETARLCNLIQELYDECIETAHQGERAMRLLNEEYSDYFRGDASRSRLDSALSCDVTSERIIDWCGATISDPRYVLDTLRTQKLSCRIGTVHGDLHPNNVVFDRRENPHLIDFAWAKNSSHVLKDYVLLENSLRFMLFPECINTQIHIQVDRALLQEDGPEQIPRIVAGTHYSAFYLRLAGVLSVIRGKAKQAAGDGYKFSEYLMAQFIVLYGLVQHENYHFHDSVRALGMIGGELLG